MKGGGENGYWTGSYSATGNIGKYILSARMLPFKYFTLKSKERITKVTFLCAFKF